MFMQFPSMSRMLDFLEGCCIVYVYSLRVSRKEDLVPPAEFKGTGGKISHIIVG